MSFDRLETFAPGRSSRGVAFAFTAHVVMIARLTIPMTEALRNLMFMTDSPRHPSCVLPGDTLLKGAISLPISF